MKNRSLILSFLISFIALISCGKDEDDNLFDSSNNNISSGDDLPSIVEPDRAGQAKAQTDYKGEILVQSSTFTSGVKFSLKDASGNPIEKIHLEYQESDNLILTRFWDPTYKFRQTIFWGNPSTYNLTNGKLVANTAIDPFTIGLILAFAGGFFATRAAYDITEAVEEIDIILDEKAINKIRSEGEPICLTIESVVDLIKSRFKGQKAVFSLAFAPVGAKATMTGLLVETAKFSLDEGTGFLIDYVGEKKVQEWGAIDKNTIFTVRINTWDNFLPGVFGGLDISIDSHCKEEQSSPSPSPNSEANQTITVTLPGGATMEMVWIEPGTFMMGSPDSVDQAYGEKPQHQVTISRGFYLGKYELTQEQWETVMGTQPWSGQDYVRSNPQNPAVYISWDDMQVFIHKLNQAAGDSLYRLLTEAEWEYACRAGTTTLWSFGDDKGRLGEYAWYRGNAWSAGLHYAQLVGTKLPNPWSLYDMHGNVLEWVQDWHELYTGAGQVDPVGPATGYDRVIRGGDFSNSGYAEYTRSAFRLSTSSANPGDFMIGARLLRRVK